MKKRGICFLMLSVMLAFSFGGCTATKKVIFPTYTSEQQYRFAAYMTPPPANVGVDDLKDNPNYILDEHYKNIADCGFDYAYAIYEHEVEDIKKVLDYCQKYNIKYLAKDFGGTANITNLIAVGKENPITEVSSADQAIIKARMDQYKDHPAFGGVLAFDEPSAYLYDNAKAVKKFYSEYLPNKEFLINLLPLGTTDVQYGDVSYTEYVDKFVEKLEPTILSYDKYPLLKDPYGNPMLSPDYLANLEDFANRSKNLDIPFYVFLLTMGHWNYRTPKNYDDLAWQVYTSMAYGSKGAQTFTYWTTMSTGEQITHGLVDWYGNKTQTWYSMQEVIKEVRAMEAAYLNFDWQNTLTYTADEDYPNNLYDTLKTSVGVNKSSVNPHSGIKQMDGNNDYIVGCFTDKDNRNGYMLSNLTDPGEDKPTNVTVTFKDANAVLVYKKGRTEKFSLKNGKYTTVLGSGEGQFVIPVK